MVLESRSRVLKHCYTLGEILRALGFCLDCLARVELRKLNSNQRPPASMVPARFEHNTVWATQDVLAPGVAEDEICLSEKNITLPQGVKYYDDQLINWYDFVENELREGQKLEDITILWWKLTSWLRNEGWEDCACPSKPEHLVREKVNCPLKCFFWFVDFNLH